MLEPINFGGMPSSVVIQRWRSLVLPEFNVPDFVDSHMEAIYILGGVDGGGLERRLGAGDRDKGWEGDL